MILRLFEAADHRGRLSASGMGGRTRAECWASEEGHRFIFIADMISGRSFQYNNQNNY